MALTATSLGSATNVIGATTVVLTVTASLAVNEEIFVGGGIEVNTGTETLSVGDSGASGGNTYTRDVSHNSSFGLSAGALFRAVCTKVLTSGSSTITLTSSGSVNLLGICAFKLAAGDILVPITTDGTNNNEGTGTSATPGSVTPTFNPDFGVMLTVSAGTGARTGTPPANWTEMFDFNNISGSSTTTALQLNRLTALTSSNTAINGTETLSGAPADWSCMQVLYKGPVGALPPARDTHTAIPFTQGAGGGSPGGGF